MLDFLSRNTRSYDDSGLSSLASNQGSRFINQDGTFNVRKTGVPFLMRISFFNALITMPWPGFLTLMVGGYFAVNFVFAVVYYLVGPEHLNGVAGFSEQERFLDIFFFSAQTLTTVGYGRINPQGLLANIIASFEAMTGLLSFALATGLMYGRFSRPVAHILFSRQALVAPYRQGRAIMFRLANTKSNQLIDAEIQVLASMAVMDNGKPVRKYYSLELERRSINFFTLNWTVVHPLDDKSPLFTLDAKDYESADLELMISLKAYDDTFAQTIHARHSYKFDEMVWDARFQTMIQRSENGRTTILRLDTINDMESVRDQNSDRGTLD